MRLLILTTWLAFGQVTNAEKPGIYTNAELHFTYSYPADFKLTPEVAEAMKNDTQARVPTDRRQAALCVTTPFAAEHSLPNSETELLLIIRADLDCLHAPIGPQVVASMAEGSLREGLIKFPSAVISSPVAYKLGPYDAFFANGSAVGEPDHRTAYSATACILVEHNALCWAAFTPSKTRLPILLATMVTFDMQSPQRIVPAALLGKE